MTADVKRLLATELADFEHVFVAIDGARRIADVYVVTQAHDDDVYRRVGDAEDRLVDRLPEWTLRLRVRAHQGRAPETGVPGALRRLATR